jgi:excinuclease ABC subunit C
MTDIKQLVEILPSNPGVYQFFDKDGKIIYIGKAKNLKKRVKSYFKGKYDNNKIRVMVYKINDIKYIVVDSESDAFLLENNLIKEYQPRYNILLKDDKSFPWICIKNEPFPRVFYTRNPSKDGSVYFGPYTSMVMVKTLMSLIKQLYTFRTCNYNLSPENIKKGKYKVCLEYHLGNCLGPCEGLQSEENYNNSIIHIKEILKGNISGIISQLKNLMISYANELKYEEANLIKEKIEIIENYKSRSTIVNPDIKNIDVFSFIEYNNDIYINFLKVIDGAIVQSHIVELKKQLDETKEDILAFTIYEIRKRFNSDANEIVVPFPIDFPENNAKLTIPVKGDKKKLLELSERNLKFYRNEKLKLKESNIKHSRIESLLQKVKNDLHLNVLPYHIECFDNSNIQGKYPVAACVVFKNCKPCKSEYRHYNIKTVEGPNDYASMEEVVYRRYKRILEEKTDLPQLIVIDGGKGQLASAYKSIHKLGLSEKITVIALAKKLEEIFFINDPVPLYLDKNSYTLKLLQQIRDEAHRFGISFHRQKRNKSVSSSELMAIEGIGENTLKKLYHFFKNIDNIKKASLAELENIIGNNKANMVFKYFHDQNKKS